MGSGNSPHVMTLVNSIIGVSILAMPFCYKQCGIVLSSLFLLIINLMTRLSCHYLLKSAIMTRRKNFEFLAFHAFGSSGKTAIELCIIFLMIGTCIAFFVVMGDLGPAIISSLLNIDFTPALRPAVLIGLAVFVVLPLGLLRNVDSLSFICTLSFLFYLLLVLKVFFESTTNLFGGSWLDEVNYWRPAGILQCLPIFSMALSCQTQLFEVFDSVQNATLDRMNLIVKYAVDVCTALYIAVGYLGYIAYYKTNLTGNLLMSFSESMYSEIIKLLFVLSVAVTFPMVIFPCRASLYSLLFRKGHVPHYELVTGGGNHIPEAQFKCITFFIITMSLVVGLLAPNIEIVLGLLGSTIGVIICLLFPPLLFIWICNKATTEKVLAQAMCFFGLFIMIMGTYANLYLSETKPLEIQPWKNPDTLEAIESKVKVDIGVPPNHLEVVNVVKPSANEIKEFPKTMKESQKVAVPEQISKINRIEKVEPVKTETKEDKRIEPPIPMAPESVKAPAPLVFENKENKIQPIAKEEPKIEKKLDAAQAENLKKDSMKIVNPVKDEKPQGVQNNGENSPQKSKIDSNKNIPEVSKIIPKQDESQMSVEKSKEKQTREDNKPKNVVLVQEDASKFVKSKPPLPILINNNMRRDSQSNDKVIQRDILEKVPNPAEREKRDLLAADETSKDQKQVSEDANVGKDNHENSFVKNLAVANADEACDKDKVDQDKTEKDEEKLKATDNKNTEAINQNNDEAIEKQKKEAIIIAPFKLSDPVLVLDHKENQNDELINPDPENIMKPLRELKSADGNEQADNRKK